MCDLQELITKHRALSAEFLEKNYDKFFTHYQQLLYSENYVTRRQALKVTNTSIDLQIGWDWGGGGGVEEEGGQRRGDIGGHLFFPLSVCCTQENYVTHCQAVKVTNTAFDLQLGGGGTFLSSISACPEISLESESV